MPRHPRVALEDRPAFVVRCPSRFHGLTPNSLAVVLGSGL